MTRPKGAPRRTDRERAADVRYRARNLADRQATSRTWQREHPAEHARAVRRSERRAREKVFETTGYACAYCGAAYPYEGLTVDHVVPSSRGGLDVPANRTAACFTCNKRKGRRTGAEFRAKLRAERGVPVDPPDWLMSENPIEDLDAERALTARAV